MLTKKDIKLWASGVKAVPKEFLLDFLKKANFEYREGHPIISDEFYDKMWERAKKLFPKDPFLNTVEEEGKVTEPLPVKMLSTRKAYSIEEVITWFNTCKKMLGMDHLPLKCTVKLDGYALYFDRALGVAYTRGDGTLGQDVSHILPILNDSLYGDGKGELVADAKAFKTYLGKRFSNPRNFLASVIKKGKRSNTVRKFIIDGFVKFVAFDQLNTILIDSDSFITEYQKIVRTLRDTCIWPNDGIVIDIIGDELRKKLGDTKRYHRWQLAFKERGLVKETEVLSILPQVGRTGRVTPVIVIKPIDIDGTSVGKLTGHNYDLLMRKGLGVGSKITITRGGDVIPRLVGVLTEYPLDPPTKCPCCKRILTKDGSHYVCTYTRCKDQLIGKFFKFCKDNKISFFGKDVFSKLVDHGVETTDQLIGLSELDLKLAKIKGKVNTRLLKSLDEYRQRLLP